MGSTTVSPGSPNRPCGVLRRSPFGVATLFVSLILAFAPSQTSHAQTDSDFRWVPPTAGKLRSLADSISDARASDDRRRTLEAIERYALSLTTGVPDGGFPIAPGRWLGPGHYLSETLSLLETRDQRDAVEAIDLELKGRLDQSERVSLRRRVHRDFPYSRFADRFLPERIVLLLESGHVESALELSKETRSDVSRTQLLSLLRSPLSPDGALPIESPLIKVMERPWGESRGVRESASSRWAYHPLRSLPLITRDAAFMLGPDQLLRSDRATGEVDWTTPFYSQPPIPLPGTQLEPQAWGDLVIGATSTHLVAADHKTGAPRWLLPVSDLFDADELNLADPTVEANPPRDGDSGRGDSERDDSGEVDAETAATDRDANAATDERPLVLSVSVRVSSHGLVISAFQLRNDYVRGRSALVDRDGRVLWNRSLGSAPGGTYLGLGHAHPALTVYGEHAYMLTQRGFLVCLSLEDGALAWAVEYPSHGPRGSRDALAYQTHFQMPDLQSFGSKSGRPWLVGTPIDSSSLIVWDASGEVRASLPKGDVRWWTLDDADRDQIRLALASSRTLEIWDVTDGELSLVREFELPEAAPSFSGSPRSDGRDWWVPHPSGYHRFSPNEHSSTDADSPVEGRWEWHFGWLDVDFDVTNLVPSGDRLWVNGPGHVAVFRAAQPEEWTGPGQVQQLLRARQMMRVGDDESLLGLMQELIGQADPSTPTLESIESRTRLGSEIVETLLPGLGESPIAPVLRPDEARRRQLVAAALALLPPGFLTAQAAFDEAIASARAGSINPSIALAYRALRDSPYSTVRLAGFLEVPVELAVRRLLAQWVTSPSADFAPYEARARRALREARASSDFDRYARVFRGYPMTQASRDAALDLAELYYRAGNRTQAYFVLSRLVLLEPDTPEGVRARFELAALHSEWSRYGAARRQLQALRESHGDLVLSSRSGTERVRDRVERLLTQLPSPRPDETPLGVDRRVDLRPVWRGRTDLLVQRGLEVVTHKDVPELGDGRFLTISSRTVSLTDARDGHVTWNASLPAPPPRSPLFPQTLGFIESPIAITPDLVVLHDGQSVFALELKSGETRWSQTLPSIRGEGAGARILRAGGDPTLAVVLDDEDRIHAFAVATGEPLWSRLSRGPLTGPPSVGERGIALAYEASARVEVLSKVDGSALVSIDLQDAQLNAGADPSQSPWFLPSGLLVVPLEKGIALYDLDRARFVWSTRFAGSLTEIHSFPELPFEILEIELAGQGRRLLGISLENRRVLWKKPINTGTIRSIHYLDGGLYVLAGTYGLNYRVIRLDLPRAFLQRDEIDLLPQTVLETTWNTSLGRTYDHYSLCDYGDWILVWGSLRSSVTVIAKQSGRTADEGPFSGVETVLRNRVSLLHADLIGETLVLLTRRGSFGLRPVSNYELTRKAWENLQSFDPLKEEPDTSANAALTAAAGAYERGLIDSACRIIESVLAEPGLPSRVLRPLVRRLEAFSQERGERHPLAWNLRRLPRAPVIDGILDEPWNAPSAVPLQRARYFHPLQGPDENGAAWRGWRDHSALLFTGWSDRGFHLALDVTDDSVHPYDRDQDRWTGDCLLLALDLRDDGGLSPGRDDQLLTLALTVPKPAPPPPPAGMNPEGDDPLDGEDEDDEDDSSKPKGEYQVLRKSDGSGVIYEITIPWETFREARGNENFPFPGVSFRMNVIVTDDDSGSGASSYMSLSVGQMLQQSTGAAFDFFSPEFFARLTLGQ